MKDLNWAAGLLEGQGSIKSMRVKTKNTYGEETDYFYPKIQIHTFNKEILDDWAEFFCIGKVHGPHFHKARNKNLYYWTSSGKKAEEILKKIYPLMSELRKKEIDKALKNEDV